MFGFKPKSSASRSSVDVRLSEVLAALSFALDLVEGQPEGHAVRSCLLGMRLAREIGFPDDELSSLFYALLLKDIGCSSNSAKVCYLFEADERVAKSELKTVDWSYVRRSIGYIARNAAPNGSLLQRAVAFCRIAKGGQKVAKELVQCRCERGASIVRELGLPEETALAIYALDEHWDGSGHPHNLRAEQIPLSSRILGIAQTVEVFVGKHGRQAAFDMARARSCAWFDPQLVKALQSIRDDSDFWNDYAQADPRKALSRYEPAEHVLRVNDDGLDKIAAAFAQVIDAKSPWTYRHSAGVSEISVGIAGVLGMHEPQIREIRRAALLHDVGKLGISNLILDKPGKLTPEELQTMRRHPIYTQSILQRVEAFRSFADLAAAHHERLDGQGYHLGLTAPQLSTAARILCVADMYEALAAHRPYRQDLSHDEVTTILKKNEGTGLCPVVLSALYAFLNQSGFKPINLAA